jgi:hypothetical protein
VLSGAAPPPPPPPPPPAATPAAADAQYVAPSASSALLAAVAAVAAPREAVATCVGVFDDLGLDDDADADVAAGGAAAAAARDDAAALLAGATALAGLAPGVEHSRWQHVVVLRAEAVLRVPAAALQPLRPRPAWRCVLGGGAAAVFLLSAPALAHKVGAADPSPAALAAGRCVAVRLAGTVRVPADEEE